MCVSFVWKRGNLSNFGRTDGTLKPFFDQWNHSQTKEIEMANLLMSSYARNINRKTVLQEREHKQVFLAKNAKTLFWQKMKCFRQNVSSRTKEKMIAVFSQVKNVATETWVTSFWGDYVLLSIDAGAKHRPTPADLEYREFHSRFTVLWIKKIKQMNLRMVIIAIVHTFLTKPYFCKTDLCALYTIRLNLRMMLAGNREKRLFFQHAAPWLFWVHFSGFRT